MPSPCARSPPHAPVFCRFAIARQLMNPYRSFLFMHRPGAGIVPGLVPATCSCTGIGAGFISDVCPGFSSCTGIGAVASGFLVCLSRILIMHRLDASASRLAGAVREIGDGLCGALLLSLRHLSTSFQGIPLQRG